MKKSIRYFAGFTLVELIVVITILVILGTIAFLNLGGFQSNARDSRRVSDMSNISQVIELALVTQGGVPIPTNAVSYTGGGGGGATLQIGTVSNTTVPRMSGDFSDPLTKVPYNYSVFSRGSYYQLGIDFENPLSFDTGIPGIERVYADIGIKYSKLSGNYTFDPSLPSLFVITGSINSASGGIFSPDACFVMNNVSRNTFSSHSGTCLKKKDYALKNLDSSLVGYWDMETLTSSGLLKDLSGNGNDGWMVGASGLPIIGSGNVGIFGLSTKYNSGGHIRINNQSKLLDNSRGITILGYIKDNDFSQGHKCIWKFHRNIATSWGGALCFNAGNFGVYGASTSSGALEGLSSYTGAITFSKNNWNFVVGVIDYQNAKLKFFLNGTKVGERDVKFLEKKYIHTDFTGVYDNLGYGTSPMPSILDGLLDDIKIYNRTLSDSEIMQQAKIAGF